MTVRQMFSMSKYFTSILFLLFSFNLHAQDDEDETDKPAAIDSFYQLRIGFDISKPIITNFVPERQAYEFELDFFRKKDIYYVLDAGWGRGYQDSSYLNYSSSNTFFKAGINKGLFTRLFPNDWDQAFVGVRYALAFIERSEARYTIFDSFWGNINGTIPGKNLTAHWLELTGGVRVELVRGIFTGWTIRGKFLLNGKQFKDLPPPYVAGYGRGDKNSIFDFNFYISYAIRWKKKGL